MKYFRVIRNHISSGSGGLDPNNVRLGKNEWKNRLLITRNVITAGLAQLWRTADIFAATNEPFSPFFPSPSTPTFHEFFSTGKRRLRKMSSHRAFSGPSIFIKRLRPKNVFKQFYISIFIFPFLYFYFHFFLLCKI